MCIAYYFNEQGYSLGFISLSIVCILSICGVIIFRIFGDDFNIKFMRKIIYTSKFNKFSTYGYEFKHNDDVNSKRKEFQTNIERLEKYHARMIKAVARLENWYDEALGNSQ